MIFWRSRSLLERFAILFLVAAAILQIVAIVRLIPNGHDAGIHLRWIEAWHRAWSEGISYPRWLPDANKEFGSPSFFFYPPASFVLSSALYTLLPNLAPDVMLRLVILLLSILSGITCYVYLRHANRSSSASVCGALLYGFAPYRFYDVEARTVYAEHAAFVLLPLLLLIVDQIIRGKLDWQRASGLALLWAALILTNIPTTAVMTLFLPLYVACRFPFPHALRRLSFLAVVLLLGAFLTAFYFVPVLQNMSWVQMGQLWTTNAGTGSPFIDIFSGKGIVDSVYAILNAIGVAAGLFFVLRRSSSSPIEVRDQFTRRVFLWSCLILLFFQLPFSTPWVFRTLPPFTLVQSAARFQAFFCIIIALAWSAALDRRLTPSLSIIPLGWSMALLPLVTLALLHFHINPHPIKPWLEPPEYRTIWTPPAPTMDSVLLHLAAMPEVTVDDTRQVRSVRCTRHPYIDTVQLDLATDQDILFHRLYWPLWTILCDGNPLAVSPGLHGLLATRVSAGTHTIILRLNPSPAVALGTRISIAAFAALCVYCLVLARRSRKSSTEQHITP
jgi:hypothetical protein